MTVSINLNDCKVNVSIYQEELRELFKQYELYNIFIALCSDAKQIVDIYAQKEKIPVDMENIIDYIVRE